MKITTLPKTINQLCSQLEGIGDLLDISYAAAGNMKLMLHRDGNREGTLAEYIQAAQYALSQARGIVVAANTEVFRAKQKERNSKYAHHRAAYYARTRAAAGKEPTLKTMASDREVAARYAERLQGLQEYQELQAKNKQQYAADRAHTESEKARLQALSPKFELDLSNLPATVRPFCQQADDGDEVPF